MNGLKTTALLATLTALLVGIGGMIGGRGGMIIAFGVALVMNGLSYWFSDKIVLSMYRAQPVDRSRAPRLYTIVETLARRAQMPMPKVYVIPDHTPNAFATGRNPENAAVAATTGLLEMLSDDEIAAVMAHELGHVANRDTLIQTIVASLAGAIGMLANMAQWAAIFGGGRSDDEEDGGGVVGLLATAILAPIAAMLVQMAISRTREFQADATGARLHGDPMALARALVKIEQVAHAMPMQQAAPATAHLFIINPLAGRRLASLFSTHPSTEERVARLQALRLAR